MILKLSENQTSKVSGDLQLGKVLHVINGEHFSGAERVQDLLAQQLPKFGYDAGFVSLKSGLFEKNRNSDVPLHTVTMRSKFDWRVGRDIARIFETGGYSLLHAHTPRSLMVAGMAAKRLDCPLVYHVHSPVGRDSKRWLANKINTLIENQFLRRTTMMICVSNSLKRYMESLGYSPTRLTVVPNGVPVIHSREIEPWTDKLTVGMVALFRPRKGTEVLLEALSILKNRNLPIRVLAVGPFETSEYQKDILALAEKLSVQDLIQWTGFERDVQSRLQQMHVMVLPSLFGEGLPMVVLEAMASGLPVVASRVEGIPEVIRNGVDGLLCQADSPIDLANQIDKMYCNQESWMEMRRNCREQHRENLSDEAMAKKTAAVYSTML